MKNICVFLGSNTGNESTYSAMTIALAKKMVQSNYGLVYGGANVGLMKILADTMLELGGRVIGVMPQILVKRECTHAHLTKLYSVNSMAERKLMLAQLSDAFIALPGGVGTFEELFQVWSEVHLGAYQKPIALLNGAGYYDKLLDFLSDAHQKGFMTQEHMKLLMVRDDPEQIVDDINDAIEESLRLAIS